MKNVTLRNISPLGSPLGRLLVYLLALTLSAALPAATDPAHSFAPVLGINQGFASATVTPLSAALYDGSSRTGLSLGAHYFYGFAKNWDLETGAEFNQRGANLQLVGLLPGTLKISSFDLPVHLRYQIEGIAGLWVAAGVNLSLLSTRSVEFLTAQISDLSSRFSGFDFSVVLQTGYEVPLSDGMRLGLSLRFLLGLPDLDSETTDYRSRDFRVQLYSRFFI